MKRLSSWWITALAVIISVMASGSAQAVPFDMTVIFGGGLTASQQAAFTTAEGFWENIITGYHPSVTSIPAGLYPPLTISASGTPIDGGGGVLGQAGYSSTFVRSGFVFSGTGTMQLDTADLANMETSGKLLDVIKHEMGHVIGIGTQWINNNVYVENSGQYTGAFGLAAYKAEYGHPDATFVPVELGGGAGTANAHWNENDNGAPGHEMTLELMTGWLNTGSSLSQTSIQSLVDIGYAVAPVPEPSTLILASLGFIGLFAARSRIRRAVSN